MAWPYYPQAPAPGAMLGQWQQPQAGIKWVVGRAGADSYMTAPGMTDWLMDSTQDVFYLKEADATGRATVRTFDFTERKDDAGGYATKADLDALKAEILEAIDAKQPVPRHARQSGTGGDAQPGDE